MPIIARDHKCVPLGSGYTHIIPFTGELPAEQEIVDMCASKEYRYGTTTKGATLSYDITIHEESDDLGTVSRRSTNKENVKLKTGVFSWFPSMLKKLVSTYRRNVVGNLIVHRIGGLENADDTSYLVVFEQVDKKYGNLYVCIVGTNTAGLHLAFVNDDTSKLEPEFTADPQDDEGTLVMLIETTPEGAVIQPAAQTEGQEAAQTEGQEAAQTEGQEAAG